MEEIVTKEERQGRVQQQTVGKGSLHPILCPQVCLVLFGEVVGVGLNLGIQKVKTAMFAHL